MFIVIVELSRLEIRRTANELSKVDLEQCGNMYDTGVVTKAEGLEL